MDSCFQNTNHFDNTLEDFNPNVKRMTDKNKFILNKIEEMVKYIEKNVLEFDCMKNECNIYGGSAGIAYMFWYLWRQELHFSLEKRTKYLQNAKTLIIRCLQSLSKHEKSDCALSQSVIRGNAGIIFMSCLIFDSLNEEVLRNYYLDCFIRMTGNSIADSFVSNGSDTYFDGRCGYISASMIINRTLNIHVVSNELIINLAMTTINSGRKQQSKKYNSPLIYGYDSILYLGNSLGFSGIVSAVLSIPEIIESKEYEPILRETIEFVMSYERANGTFPYSVNSIHHSKECEETINWCNGSAGIVWLLAKAYKIWKSEKYLKACIKCGEIVWKRGLSQNSPGICHGISGNGYCFLLLHKLTDDPRHLQRAQEFAKFIIKEYKEVNNELNNPFGLFEGYSGVICYLVDVLNAHNRKDISFPLFFNIV